MPRPIMLRPAIRLRRPTPDRTNPLKSKRGTASSRKFSMNLSDSSDAENADRHVDPENPAPMEIGGDEAAERRTRDRADQRGHGEIGHRVDEIALRRGAQQHEPPDRHHHRAAQPLEHARGDQRRERRRGAAQDRAEGEDDDRAAEHRARAEAVGDPAGGGNEHRERQHVGGQRELEDDRVLMQVERDRRQRGRNDGPVHVLHEQGGRDDEGGEEWRSASGVFRPCPSGAAARPPQGEAPESPGHNGLKLERRPLCRDVHAHQRSDDPRRKDRRCGLGAAISWCMRSSIQRHLAMLDPVQCMLDMSGMLDLGTPSRLF